MYFDVLHHLEIAKGVAFPFMYAPFPTNAEQIMSLPSSKCGH